MNHCYRLVFNSATYAWQAVAETAKSHTKSGGKLTAVVLLPILILGISNVSAEPAANVLPAGGQVVSGQSIITQNGNLLNIQQTTQKSIINWTTFNIGASSHVNYDQLNTSSISLNRVLSADPSTIFGKLTSNGQIWLINPNGILFGQSAQVNVGGLLASTLNITDDNFLSGNYKFTGSTGSVVNMGNIVASNGGYVAMLAPEVRNEGVISALQGTSVLAAGDAMALDFNGNGLINVQVDSASINTLIENKNLIKVGNGQVLMSTRAADGLITSVINNSGRIEADSMVSDGGVVRLTGAKTVIHSGEISAQSLAGKGGIVHILGENVAVMDAGSINANGKTGGGTILIGGNIRGLVSGALQGKNPIIQNANKTLISQDAKLTADATDTGNGGKVIVWADDITRYYGSISAKGGVNGGNGGFAEVSGKRLLNFLGAVDLSAAHGIGGNLLLDPLNITLSLGTDTNTVGFTVPSDLTEAFADDLGLTSTFNVGAGGSFSGIATGSTIILQATNNITISNAFDVETATGSANNSLVLQADNNISVNAAVTTTGTGAITMAADADGSGAGNVAIAAAISAQSGGITLSGVNITRSSGNITSIGASGFNGGNINMIATGAIALSGATVANNGGGLVAVGGNAGNINISAGTGFSMLGAIVSGGPASLGANTAGGNGGNVSITSATGNVSTGAITTNGGNAGAGIANGSNAGSISVVATAGNVSTGALTARTGLAAGTGVSGAVASVTASGVNVTLGAINTSGQALSNGNGGSITANATGILTLNGAVNSSGGTVITDNAGKNAGAINFIGNSITSVAAGTITASGSDGLGTDQAGGNGATVSLTATGAISSRAITANGGNGVATSAAGGNAGSISIATNTGNITTNAGALTARTGAGIGAGANSTQGFITVNNSSAAGTIATGAISTTGNTNGHGGNISVTGNGGVTIGGTLSSSGGTSTGTRAGRNAGNLTVTGTTRSITGAITANGGAGIGANQAGGNAGVVSITGADTLNTAAITTSTGARTGAGAGGVAGSITLSGSSLTSTALSTAAGAGGVGGNVSITTAGATTSSIASINATANGAINMNVTDTLTVSGVITGTGTTLTKTGVGSVILAGPNTYTGLTQVQAGTLSAANATALGDTGTGTTVASGATLNVSNITLAAEAITLASTAALTGTNVAILAGIVTAADNSTIGTTSAASSLTLAGALSAVGSLGLVGAGNITAINAANNFSTVNINAAKNVSLRDSNNIIIGNGASNLTGNLTVQAGGNVTVNNNVATSGGDITLAGVNFINNAGASALSASGRWLVYANTHTGNTFGGLNSANQAIWSTNYPVAVSQTGNRFVFANSPTVTVTSTNQVKTYGQNGAPIVANAFTATGFINAATFGNVFTQDTTANSLTGSATSTGSAVTANVGNYAIDVTSVTATTGYTLNKNSTGYLTANPAVINSAGTRSYNGTTAFNAGAFGTFSTGINGEDLSLSGAGSVASANAGVAQTLTTGTLELVNGTGLASNYTLTGGTHTGTITKADTTVSANSNSLTYNGTSQSVSGFTASVLFGSDILTGLSAGGTGINAGTYASTITGSNTNTNYNVTSLTNGSLVIGKADLTVTANDSTRIQGSVNPAFSSIITGFVNAETSAVLIGALDYSTPATISSPAGNYAITPFNVLAANYTISFVDGILNVTPLITPPIAPPSPLPLGAPNLTTFNGSLIRPEQALQTCGAESANSAMISGLDAFGADDVEYKESVSQPQIGGVVANALISPACLKI